MARSQEGGAQPGGGLMRQARAELMRQARAKKAGHLT